MIDDSVSEPATEMLIAYGVASRLDSSTSTSVVEAMGERMPALLDRSHGKRIQDYDT